MYMGDADDTVPLLSYTIHGATLNGILNPDVEWPQMVQPYVKNWQIFRDPGSMIDPLGVWNPGPFDWFYNWMRWPEFGYNVDYLNEALPNCSNFGTVGNSFGPPISATSPDAPADTVLLTTTKVVGSSTGAYASDATEAPASVSDSEDCTWSNGGWGTGSYGDSPGLYPGNPTGTGTFSIKYTGGGNVAFMDGHAKFMLPGRLAAGTNWTATNSNTQTIITDRTKYLWSASKS